MSILYSVEYMSRLALATKHQWHASMCVVHERSNGGAMEEKGVESRPSQVHLHAVVAPKLALITNAKAVW